MMDADKETANTVDYNEIIESLKITRGKIEITVFVQNNVVKEPIRVKLVANVCDIVICGGGETVNVRS